MKRKFDLIVFDWDGTLMDSEAKIVHCMQAAAADAGLPPLAPEAARHIIGLGLREAIASLYPDADLATRQRMSDSYREHFTTRDQTESMLFPGVADGLAALSEAGYLLAVATGKARRGLDRVLADTGTRQWFAATRCADEAFSKPHPRMLYDLLDQTGVATERALMIGDTIYDLEMAVNARIPGLAVTYGAHERERLLDYAPLACLDSFSEVRDWLA